MKKYIALALWLCAAVSQAANIAVGPAATGNGLGGDWNNLMSWNGTLVRGNTYYLVDAETYGGKILNTAVIGSSLITIKKATIADHGGITTGWNNAMGDGRALFNGAIWFQTSYWVFDGVTGGGPGQWTSNFGFKVFSTGIRPIIEGYNNGSPLSNFTVRHVEVSGNGPDGDTAWGQDGIQFSPASNVTISYAYIHDTGRCLVFAGHGSNWVMEYLYTGRGESVAAEHAETFQFDTVSNYTVRWSIFRHATGTCLFAMHGTDIKIYGNAFYPDPALGAWDDQNGVIGGWTSGNLITNCVVYNNTFVNITGKIFGTTSAGSGGITRNNYFYNCSSAAVGGPFGGTVSHNHWQSSIGAGGTNSTTGSGDPFVAGTLTALEFKLASNTTAGQTLAAPFNVDWTGFTRSTWTRGAVEFSGSDTLPPILTGELVTVDGTGLIWTFTFSEAIRVGTGGFGGWVPSMTGGPVTLSGFGIVGSVLTATGSRALDGGETGTIAYTQPGNGIEDLAFNDFATFSGADVDNNAVVNAVITPSIDLASGYYYGTQTVTLDCDTPGATIRYRLDGSDPTTSSPIYLTPLSLSAGATLKAFATKAGMGNSLIETAIYQIGTWGSNNDFQNIIGIPQQTGVFTWSFRVTPPEANVATHIGLSPTTVDDFDDWAAIIRLNSIDSSFDVRNGDIYDSDATVVYAGGTSYDVVVVVDVTKADQEILSVSVAPAGGSPTVIATNYDFRTSQDAATELDGVGMLTTVSTQPSIVTNMSFVPGVPGGGGAGVVPSASNLMISDP